MIIGFWKVSDDYGFCSNWYKADMVIDNIVFCCCEQYLMYRKALLFNDLDIAKKILASNDPKEMKALGRQVSNFDTVTWEANRDSIMEKAVLAKFMQHPDLWKQLDMTEDNIIAEASPLDRIWGIGIGANNKDLQYISKWRGLNLLGKAIMKARQTIRESNVN